MFRVVPWARVGNDVGMTEIVALSRDHHSRIGKPPVGVFLHSLGTNCSHGHRPQIFDVGEDDLGFLRCVLELVRDLFLILRVRVIEIGNKPFPDVFESCSQIERLIVTSHIALSLEDEPLEEFIEHAVGVELFPVERF